MDSTASADDRLPLSAGYQSRLLRQLCEDRGFAVVALPHLQPHFFENPIEAWAFRQITQYHQRYVMPPPFDIVLEQARTITDPAERLNTETHLLALANAPALLPDAAKWLSDQVLRFVRRQFLRAMLSRSVTMANSGQLDAALEYTIEQTTKLAQINPRASDRSSFFEELDGRMQQRCSPEAAADRVPTGFPTLDRILDGGLARGELGIWMAYAKNGKTTMLTNLGATAARCGRKVLHLVYEGRRQQVEARYDSIFAGFAYSAMKKGNVPFEVVQRMRSEYGQLRGNLVIRGFTSQDDDAWNCSIESVLNELTFLRETSGWVPDAIVIDYIDLLRARDKGPKSETEHQNAACRDVKTLATQGYAIWSASQPQRPSADWDIKPHLLKSINMADAYGKNRILDFLGSINMTSMERDNKVARLYAELYRDGAADTEWMVRCDLSTMTIREEPNVVTPHIDIQSGVQAGRVLGYMPAPTQRMGF